MSSLGENQQRMGDSAPGEQLAGGRLLSEITNRLVVMMRENYGRGPIKAKSYVLDNMIFCVFNRGLTPIERTMVEAGEADRVLEIRRDLQRVTKTRYVEMLEALAGGKVLAVLNQAHLEPDVTIAVFMMEGPVPGFGASGQADADEPCASPAPPEPHLGGATAAERGRAAQFDEPPGGDAAIR